MTSAAKIGVLMLVIIAIAGFFVMKIEDFQFGGSGDIRKVDVVFNSVAGLNEKASVRMAGVRIGKVAKVSLTPQGKALVSLEIDSNVPLRTNASASVANLGLLGEKYIELNPGTASAPLVAKGQKLVLGSTSTSSIDDVTNQVADIATDVKAITQAMRATLGGPAGEQRLNEIVDNVRVVTAQMRLLLEVNQGNVTASAENIRALTADLRVAIPRIAASIDRMLGAVGGTVGENRQDVRVIVDNLRGLSNDLKTSATNLNDITGQMKSGEGSVGKLLYSDEAHTRLTSALTSVESGVNELRNTLGRVGKIELDLGIKADYLAGRTASDEGFDGSSRSGVFVRLVPDPAKNRFFNVELNDDPRGKRKEKIIVTETTDGFGKVSTVTTRETKFERDFLVSAQAGWKLDDLSLRVGLFDSSGGVGADYDLNERLRITGEAFDFGKRRDSNPNIRLFGRYELMREKANFPAVFVSTGVENALNDTAFILGGGIRWRDDDLKYLLGSIPGR